jgi:hypothetical protein
MKKTKHDNEKSLFQGMDSENMLVFYENYREFSSAIMAAGGNPACALDEVEGFMRSLAVNKIRIYAEHNPLKLGKP